MPPEPPKSIDPEVLVRKQRRLRQTQVPPGWRGVSVDKTPNK